MVKINPWWCNPYWKSNLLIWGQKKACHIKAIGCGFLLFWAALSPGTVVYVPCHQPSVSASASASAPVPFPSSLESLSPARSPASRQNLKPPAALFYIAASGSVHYRIRVSRCSLCGIMVIHCNTERLVEYNLDLVNVIINYVLLYYFFLWLTSFSSTQILYC